MSHHLGYPPGAAKPSAVTNQRNGSGAKTVLTEDGPIRIEVPRDRDGSFEPLLMPKHERRFTGFDDKIVAMYARGMTVREIQGCLQEQYDTAVSPDFISSVTDEVMAEVTALASAAVRTHVPGRVLRRATGQDSRRRRGAQQGDLPCAGRSTRRHTRYSGLVDRRHRRRQVLDEGLQRSQDGRRR